MRFQRVNHVPGESKPGWGNASVESGSDEDGNGILAKARCAMTQLDSRVGTMDFVGEKPVRAGTAKKEDRVEIVAGLAGYLAKLGLADGKLDQMITMMQSGRQEEAPRRDCR